MINAVTFNKYDSKIIAHRGVSKLETENSMPAFIAAGNRSYFGIECDVHPTADGKFVIIHDHTTGRVADRDFGVETSDYDTLRAIRKLRKNMPQWVWTTLRQIFWNEYWRSSFSDVKPVAQYQPVLREG